MRRFDRRRSRARIVNVFARDDRRGLVATVLLTVGVAAVTNGTLAAFGLNRRDTEIWPAFAPPGHSIGLIWVALFALMGFAYWYVARRAGEASSLEARGIVALIVMCLAYPFYTHVVGGHAIELVGNVGTLALAGTLAVRLRTLPAAAASIGAVALWVVFATVLVVALISLNGWRT